MRGLQEVRPEIEELGASLVAVSPQTPDNSLELVESNSLTFEVLSDVRSYVASDYGIVFALTSADRELFLRVGNDLAVVNDDDAWLLPAPATFVIAADGIIQHADVSGDYTRRIDPAVVLAALRRIAPRVAKGAT